MRISTISVAAATALLCMSVTSADQHEEEYQIRPIEIYGCNYNEGKRLDDLNGVIGRWNNWMDSENQESYWAFLLHPMYHSAELEYDVLWVGGWPDGMSMGQSMQHWTSKGGKYQAEFARVVDCGAVLNFATLDLARFPDPWSDGPVEFTNCTVKEGRKFTDALEAIGEWAKYQAERVPDVGHYMLFPAFGETSDADYTFKWVSRFSYKNFGANYDMYGTGGGWRKAEELFEGLLDCDSSRLYHGTAVRQVDLEE